MYNMTIIDDVGQKTNTFYLSSVLIKLFMIFLISMFYTKIRMIYCIVCTTGALPLCSLYRFDGGRY